MKRVVRTILRAEATRLGGLTQAAAEQLVGLKSLQRLVQGTPIRPRDLAWAWVAELQRNGDPSAQGLARRSRGPLANINPMWREVAEARSGWVCSVRCRFTPAQYELLTETEVVLTALHASQVGARIERENEANPPLNVNRNSLRAAWMTLKRREVYKGAGGKKRFNVAVGILMVHQLIEGEVPSVLEGDDWWGQVMDIFQKVTGRVVAPPILLADPADSAPPLGALVDKGKLLVVVDFMAGSQSLRRPTLDKSLTYIPLDNREFVYSHNLGTVVQNVLCDFREYTPTEVHNIVAAEVKRHYRRGFRVLLLWWSPDCTTFNKMDSSNSADGNNYRDHSLPHHPPILGTVKGDRAQLADELVQHVFSVLDFFMVTYHCPVAIENPEASLQRQGYMIQYAADRGLVKHKVNYCAYNHPYFKPTNIWFNLPWTPEGTTATGTCKGNCGQGYVNPETGRYKHRKTIGRLSAMEVGQGAEKQSIKAAVPEMLLNEILEVSAIGIGVTLYEY